MSARRFAFLAALAMFVGFIALNVIANSWLRSWRIDLTENQLYSLSPGTQRTLDQLTEPVELTLYYSRDATARYPQLQTYASRVREMLQTFAARSHGRVRFVEVNVKPFSEDEDNAAEYGIQPVGDQQQGADPIYFGLTGSNAIDDRRTISFFDPQREPFLEYEITRLVYELENPEKTKVALITALPIDPAAAGDPRSAAGQSVFAQELGRLMDVTKLQADFSEIPVGTDVLAIIHPGPLTPAQSYAIDQFVLRHGRAFIALDPASMSAAQNGGLSAFNPMPTMETASTLEPLLSRWGVQMSSDVVLDLGGALPVPVEDGAGGQRTAPQPLFIRVPATEEQLDRHDLMTAWLNRGINFAMPGALTASERPGVETHWLARTSGQTRRLAAPIALMRPSPYDLINDWPPGGRIETIALRLTGPLETAYPEGPPEGAAPPREGEERLTRSATPAQLVIVADTDFLEDAFYVDQSGAAQLDNGSFALNAIDVLGGSDALVSLRSRARATREMTRVVEMENAAQRSIERRQRELQEELQQTEDQLAELQARGRGSGFFSGDLGAELTPEERAALEGFRSRVTAVRTELRGVERNLRGDIERLEALVFFINVWLAPILVAAAGLFLFWRRQRRSRRGAGK
ncbi:Gldg family protein [Terricaulis sp.]|uniref:GldG family protein n=1 Tax=Terricaulis sp. TaxID=2768686 RepID=UPI0037831E53